MTARFIGLLVLLLASIMSAETQLVALLNGTKTTPPLSGLPVSLMEGGNPTESYAFGSAQSRPGGIDEPANSGLTRRAGARFAARPHWPLCGCVGRTGF